MTTPSYHLQLLYDSDQLLIFHNHHEGWLQAQWQGYYDNASARAGCAQLLQLVRQTRSTRLLNDSSEVYGEWQQAAEWVGQDFMGQLHEAGVQAIAWINAMDWPSRNAVATALHHPRQPLIRAFEFDQVQEACAWLRNPTP